MNYEKLYKEALERARNHKNNDGLTLEQYQTIDLLFPELKESEDERIRKELKRAIAVALDYSYFGKETADNCIAWLEKQAKQTQQTPQWMINFLNENRCKFASLMDDYDEQREAGGKLDAIIDWLERQWKKGG